MDTIIFELKERVIEVSRSYAICMELVVPENNKYQKTLTNFSNFFNPTAEVHFQSVVVGLYQLFDTRRGTKSIPHLLKLAPQSELLRKLKEKCEWHSGTLKKVKKIRCEVYAHRNASRSPEEVLTQVNLSFDGLGALIEIVEEIVCELATGDVIDSVKLSDEIERCAYSACKSLQLILEALSLSSPKLNQVTAQDDMS